MTSPWPFQAVRPVTVIESRVPIKGWTANNVASLVVKPYSLVFVVDAEKGELLLGLKKRGFGVGIYNGFGGKPLRDESMRECAMRELKEECGLVPSSNRSFREVAQLVITRPTSHSGVETLASSVTLVVDVYVCDHWQGEPTESEEMCPRWFSVDVGKSSAGVPFSQMWPEAAIYLPPLLRTAIDPLSFTTKLFVRVEYDWVRSDQAIERLPLAHHTVAPSGGDLEEALVGYWIGSQSIAT